MANTYKNIVITPNNGSATDDPKIVFSGANNTVNTDITLRVYPTSNGTLSFEGSAGQLFSVTNDLSGTLFSVNDISGIPSLEVDANGEVTLAEFSGNVGIGTGSPTYKLDVSGDMRVTGNVILGDASTDTITLNGSMISLGNNQSIDSGTLFIDAVNNEVGIGTTAPVANLHVIGSTNITSVLIVGTMNVVPTVQASFLAANSAYANANSTHTSLVANWTATNAAFSNANTTHTLAIAAITAANASFANGNTNFTVLQSVFGAVNAAFLAANSAYNNANSKFSSSGGTISGDVSISGVLTVTGNTLLQNVSTLSVGDPLIYLASNNYTSDLVDIGFIANYVNATGSNVHTGIFRDFSSKEYYVFEGYDKEPINNHVDPAGNNFTISMLNASIRSSNIILNGINLNSWIAASYTAANAAFANANTTHTSLVNNWGATNAAFANANTTHTSLVNNWAATNAAFSNANTTHTSLVANWGATNAAFANANTTHTLAISAITAANASFANGNTNFTVLQAAFLAANSAFANANSTHTSLVANWTATNAAFTKANGAVQTAFPTIVANGNTITATTNNSTLTIIAGTNIGITTNVDNNGIVISSTASAPAGGLSYTANVGNGTANTFNIAHGLNTTAVIPAVRELATGYYVYPDMKYTSANNIVLEFVSAPTTNQYFIIVLGA